MAADYESLRWLQLHIRGGRAGDVIVRRAGYRRRRFDFPVLPEPPDCGESTLNHVMSAQINMLVNSAQDAVVDGMARERQQYSGDGAHQLRPIRAMFGSFAQSARFLRTFAKGQTPAGYYLDTWPAYDRLARMGQMQLGVTRWGPVLDHGVQFAFDNYLHYQDTGRLEDVLPQLDGLVRAAHYYESIIGDDGLCPVEGLNPAIVWMDHFAYNLDPAISSSPCMQHRKQCAFNLYVIGMLRHALCPLLRAAGRDDETDDWLALSESMLQAVQALFWDDDSQSYVNNLPWFEKEGGKTRDDRALAMALLYDLCPSDTPKVMAAMLASPGASNVALSYPCNAVWRLSALARFGYADLALNELRERWAKMPSVQLNNTVSENFAEFDQYGLQQWSHCAVGPAVLVMNELTGISPTTPGYESVRIAPRPGALKRLRLQVQTVRGTIGFDMQTDPDQTRHFHITLPAVISSGMFEIAGKTYPLMSGAQTISLEYSA